MTIEWWMLDGLVGLIVLIAVIVGIARGIGDGVLRIIGFVGGLVLGVMYWEKVGDYISGTSLRGKLYDHIYDLILPWSDQYAQDAQNASQNAITETLNPADDPFVSVLPKTLRGLVTDLASEAAESAADKLTTIAISILSFVLILFAVWLAMAIIRALYRYFRDASVVIGFVDRLGGFVLGVVRGLLFSCIAMAALIPVTAIIAPDKVPEILSAMKDTYVAGVIYDINPFMLLIKYILG